MELKFCYPKCTGINCKMLENIEALNIKFSQEEEE
jgi:hypothetical protein